MLLLAGLWLWWHAPLDVALHRAIRLPDAKTWARRVRLFTLSGSISVVAPALLLAALWLWRRGWARRAAWMLATVVSGRIVVELLKHLVHRQRPPLADRLAVESSYSMPSAHASGTTIAVLALAIALGGGPWAWAAALGFAGAIGWSRVALAVHWPSDVLVGWGFGLLWIAAALRFYPLRR